jgi:hypothetical protein
MPSIVRITVAVLALVACGTTVAQVQDQYQGSSVGIHMPQPMSASQHLHLGVRLTDLAYHVSLVNAFEYSPCIMFIGVEPGTWPIDFGGVVGAVELSVMYPTDFLLGYADSHGSVHVAIPKPTNLPPSAQLATVYAQVVSVSYQVVEGRGTTQHLLDYRFSNVLPFVLHDPTQP